MRVWEGGGDWGVLAWPSSYAGFPSARDPQAAVGAQSFASLAVVWCGNFLVLSFASRTLPEWRIRESSFWYAFAFTSVSSIALQLAFNAAYATSVTGSARAAFPSGIDPGAWSCLVVVPPLLVPGIAHFVKSHDRKRHSHAMQLLRLDFETRLGQFSPR